MNTECIFYFSYIFHEKQWLFAYATLKVWCL